MEKTPWCSKNTSSVLRKHSFVDAEKTPPGAEKTLGPQKNTFLMLQKHAFFGCWKNTAGADKTPWMLRKPRVLKKHLLDAEKVPDAGKTPFQCRKNTQPPKNNLQAKHRSPPMPLAARHSFSKGSKSRSQ